MRRVEWLAIVVVVALAAVGHAQQMGSDARAQQLIRELKLQVLPKESGYLGIIGVTPQAVEVNGRKLAAQSQNYYMLTRERPINYLHSLAPADTHILIEVGPVDYYIFHPDGWVEKVTLGMDLAKGERPVENVGEGGLGAQLDFSVRMFTARTACVMRGRQNAPPMRAKVPL